MKYYITIDGGTTNTRVNLIRDNKLVSSAKISLGARDCVSGSDELKSAICDKIDNLCLQNSLKSKDLTAIIASGMITCEYGVFTLAHLPAPVGIAELHNGMQRADGIFGTLDCYFIPGVKVKSDSPLSTDMMRGEEAEIFGIYRPELKDAVYILPGSHSKHVYTDGSGRISHFKTVMTGEMISALASGTILKATVRLDLDGFDADALIEGYNAADDLGLGDALFKVRIMKNLFDRSDLECYSFFLGAVMHDEVESLAKSNAKYAVIGGKGQLRETLATLLRAKTDLEVITLDDKETEQATAIGAIRIFEF